MSNEPGERRRRRELERARELVKQQAAAEQPTGSDGSAGPVASPPSPPLSRRAQRDRKRAAVVATTRAAAAPPAGSTPSAAAVGPGQRTYSKETEASGGPESLTVIGRVPEVPAAPQPSTVARPAQARVAKVRAAEPVVAKVRAAEPAVAKVRAAEPAVAKVRPAPLVGPSTVRPDSTGPAVPEPRPVTSPSRRSMRTPTGPVDSVRTPVVHPPATTGTIRAVVPGVDRPADRRVSTDGATAARVYPPVAPRRTSPAPSAGAVIRTPSAARSTTPDVSPLTLPPFVVGTAAPETAAPETAAPETVAPGSQAGWSPLTDASAPSPARRGSTGTSPDTGGGAPLNPRWGHVPLGSFDAITRTPADDELLGAPAGPRTEERDAPPARRAASHTWLLMLALALVAFVLGFLVWLLIGKGSSGPGAVGASAPAPTISSSASSSPHLGEQRL